MYEWVNTGMTTIWTLPTVVTQYAEAGAEAAHISWNDTDNFNKLIYSAGRPVQTTKSLYHIARSPKHDISTKTYYIRATGFAFQSLPATISGIAVRVSCDRRGRIADETIQLCVDGNFIGDNTASLPILPIKEYGGANNLWGLNTIPVGYLQNSTFGVVIRLQSHPSWPHRDHATMNAVEMQIF
jgi:hypothetical protein